MRMAPGGQGGSLREGDVQPRAIISRRDLEENVKSHGSTASGRDRVMT